jgi:hypothetical protein
MSEGRNTGCGLDLFCVVGSTAAMTFYDTLVLCQPIDTLDAIKNIKYMARQRCVGANGNCTG